jgi:hypothetical protein
MKSNFVYVVLVNNIYLKEAAKKYANRAPKIVQLFKA